nr:hypothetical protein [Flavobacterium sp. ASV13]
MANHYYIISEASFFNSINDNAIHDFILETGIDLKQSCNSKMPTVSEIKNVLIKYKLDTTEIFNQNGRIELIASKNNTESIGLVFTQTEDENEPVNMFEILRGSHTETVIDFVKFLAISCGNFLYYCDSGIMSLITKDKNSEIIRSELNM